MELRWLYDRRNVEEARRDLAAWLVKWTPRYPKLCSLVEENIDETLSFYRRPRQHHKNLKSTNMLERIMEEIQRRTLVVRIFPNAASCLRLVRTLAVEIHENWIEAIRYLNMEPLREQKKDLLRQIGEAAWSPPVSALLSKEGAAIAGPSSTLPGSSCRASQMPCEGYPSIRAAAYRVPTMPRTENAMTAIISALHEAAFPK
jgi:hypothetical protein